MPVATSPTYLPVAATILNANFRGRGENPGVSGPVSWIVTLPFAFDSLNTPVERPQAMNPGVVSMPDPVTWPSVETVPEPVSRSEERRVGKEC